MFDTQSEAMHREAEIKKLTRPQKQALLDIQTGGEMMTEEWTLFPGRYRVTLTGSGFDHSYIYARYGLINQETYKLDIDFTGIDPNEMTFEFTATEMLHYWRTAVHTLDAANVTVNSVTVEKVG